MSIFLENKIIDFLPQCYIFSGWVVFQRRMDNSVDFKRDWMAYKKGFGNLQHEFWLGLENLFITQLYADDRRGSELRVDFTIKEGNSYYEKYGVFQLGDESTKYHLKVGGYSGKFFYITISIQLVLSNEESLRT